jgi:hypothetical protein
MAITVCHYPPGTSKWNKIEHRFFSFISLNWKGKPLVNFETLVNLIGGTRTSTGLKVTAVLDTNQIGGTPSNACLILGNPCLPIPGGGGRIGRYIRPRNLGFGPFFAAVMA